MANGYLRLHFKTLAQPAISLEVMFEALQRAYAAAKIQVRLVSTEALNLPDLAVLEVGDCESELTEDQRALFANRGTALASDVVAFICETLVPPYDGCSIHPPDQPGVVIARGAPSPWTLAHEVGHLLGLSHVDDDDRLMTGNGPENITNLPPDLVPEEIQLIRQSPLVVVPSKSTQQMRELLESHVSFSEKLKRLPEDGQVQLAALASSGESGIACKAVYLASLQSEPAAEGIVTSALCHPLPEVRVTAAAAIRNLRPAPARRLRALVLEQNDDSMMRALHSGSTRSRGTRSRKGTPRKSKKRRRSGSGRP